MLLQAGADTALKDKRGFTAIHIALFERKCQSVAEILMADRTALNSVDDDGKSALMIAIETNNMTILERLLQAGADTTLKDKNGHTALHIALFEVEKHSVAKILMTDATALNSVDDDGRTALMTAVIKDDLTSIQRLLEAGADTTLKDKSGHTSLHIALFEVEKHSAAKILMADKAALNSVDSGGRTALMIAVRKGDLNSMQMLLKAGADTTAIDKHGDTALHIAMYESDCLSCAEVLMTYKAALNSVNDAGRTALMTAVEKEDLTSLQMLLQAGADTALKDKRGFTAIHIALFERKCQSVAEILMADRTALNSVDDDGKSALMIAIEKNDMTILERLLQAGADTTLKDKNGHTALHIALFEVEKHSVAKILMTDATQGQAWSCCHTHCYRSWTSLCS
jgi:ankyrin repeat protein